MNRKKSNKEYYKKNKNKIKKKVSINCKKNGYRAQKKYQSENKEKIMSYNREYEQKKAEIWQKLPEDKKLELMNNFCKELI